jgi:hypothetical protein
VKLETYNTFYYNDFVKIDIGQITYPNDVDKDLLDVHLVYSLLQELPSKNTVQRYYDDAQVVLLEILTKKFQLNIRSSEKFIIKYEESLSLFWNETKKALYQNVTDNSLLSYIKFIRSAFLLHHNTNMYKKLITSNQMNRNMAILCISVFIVWYDKNNRIVDIFKNAIRSYVLFKTKNIKPFIRNNDYKTLLIYDYISKQLYDRSFSECLSSALSSYKSIDIDEVEQIIAELNIPQENLSDYNLNEVNN